MLDNTHHPSDGLLTADLRRAFSLAQYRFEVPEGELLLQIDIENDALRRLLAAIAQDCAAAITAYNPGGKVQDEASNHRAQQQLDAELRSLGFSCFPGRHEDADGRWPAEFSTLAVGISCAAACRIAARYGQLAIVWSGADARPRLVETGVLDPL